MPADISSHTGRLGDHFKVSRGTVTGNRSFFVMSRQRAKDLGLETFALPVIVSSREFAKTTVLRDSPDREVVIVVPPDIDLAQHPAVNAWLRSGRTPTGKTASWWYFTGEAARGNREL